MLHGGLLPALSSLLTKPAPQSHQLEPSVRQSQLLLSWVHWEWARKQTGTSTSTPGGCADLPMAQTTLCPLCQKEPRLSSSCCWNNADLMEKTQLPHPSGPAAKVPGFCTTTVAQELGFFSVHPPKHALCNGTGVCGSHRECSETGLVLERPGAMRSCQTHPLPKSRLRPGLAHLQS